MATADPFDQMWLKTIKEWRVKSTYPFSPASLFLASSTSGRVMLKPGILGGKYSLTGKLWAYLYVPGLSEKLAH
jgi:hypothetical protein